MLINTLNPIMRSSYLNSRLKIIHQLGILNRRFLYYGRYRLSMTDSDSKQETAEYPYIRIFRKLSNILLIITSLTVIPLAMIMHITGYNNIWFLASLFIINITSILTYITLDLFELMMQDDQQVSATESSIREESKKYPAVGKWFLTEISDIKIHNDDGKMLIYLDLPYDKGAFVCSFPYGWDTEDNFIAGLADKRGIGPNELDLLNDELVLVRRNDENSWNIHQDDPISFIQERMGDDILEKDIQVELIEEKYDIVINNNNSINGIVVENIPDNVLPEDNR